MKEKCLSVLVIAAMLLGLLGFPAFAAEADPVFFLQTETQTINVGTDISITIGFSQQISSNTAVVECTFDPQTLRFVDFAAAQGVSIITRDDLETGVKLVFMVADYSTQTYGDLILHAAQPQDAPVTVQAGSRYVIRNEDASKEIRTADADTALTVTAEEIPQPPELKGDTNYDGAVDLLDLSNMIDWMGRRDSDPDWERLYRFFDFNVNGEIDAYDVSSVAALVSFRDGSKPDASALLNAIDRANQIDAAAYTEASVSALKAALAAAKQAIAEAVDQATMDRVTRALENALALLVEKNPFRYEDVQNESAYFFTPVYWAKNRYPQITNGTSATRFSPYADCTRAQVVTFLWRAAGMPGAKSGGNPFTDLDEKAYYYNAVLCAAENGITNGVSETRFSPDGACTRAQIVTFLWRFEGRPAPTGAETGFVDLADGAYYLDAVLWAVETGVTTGVSETKFAPDSVCTRAQAVTFLYRDFTAEQS